MKQSLSFILIGFFLFSCKKGKQPLGQATYELAQHPGWSTENFKRDFNIQFPDTVNWKGGIKWVALTGNYFCKYNNSGDSLYYRFIDDVDYLSDFGFPEYAEDEALVTTINNKKFHFTYYALNYPPYDSIYMPSRILFKSGDSVKAVFVYNDTIPNPTGILYWKTQYWHISYEQFYQAAMVRFKKEYLPEIIEILRTIKRKV
jgi:hypothetical protein